MILNEKGILKQFGIVVYPVDFVVVIGEMEEEVNKIYEPFSKDRNWIVFPNTAGATYQIREKATGIPCIMVWIQDKEEFTTSIVSHECAHAAMEIWRYIGSEVALENQEPFAYLLGNLVRLAVGCFYEIPGIKPPVVKKDAFENDDVSKLRKSKSKKK